MFFVFLSSCSFFKDPIVLQIDSQKWSNKQFAKLLAKKAKSFPFSEVNNPTFTEKIKNELVADLVNDYLIKRWAKAQNISIPETEIQQALKKIKSPFKEDKKLFGLYLQRKKQDKLSLKKQIKKQLLHKKVLNKIGEDVSNPSIEEIKNYYKDRQNLFKKPDQIFIYHFFDKKKLNLMKLKKALKENSEIKNFNLKPFWVQKGTSPVFDKGFDIKKKDFSEILSSNHGYHIIWILDKKKEHTVPFEKAKKIIEKKLLHQRKKAAFLKWLDEEGKTLRVLKNEEMMKKIYLRKL